MQTAQYVLAQYLSILHIIIFPFLFTFLPCTHFSLFSIITYYYNLFCWFLYFSFSTIYLYYLYIPLTTSYTLSLHKSLFTPHTTTPILHYFIQPYYLPHSILFYTTLLLSNISIYPANRC